MYLIYGFGISNRSLARYLLEQKLDFCIWDDSQIALNEAKSLGYSAFDEKHWPEVSLAIVSPGVSRNLSNPIVAKCRKMNIKITNDVEMFLEIASGFKIAVTGSFGKSTCVALFKHIYDCFLEKNPHSELSSFQIAGNFGIPCFDCSNTAPSIFEFSAQQLDLCKAPALEVGVIVNLYEQHLDDFGTFERYFLAKEKILTNSKIRLIGDGVPEVLGAKRISSKTAMVDYSILDRKIYENGIQVEELRTHLAPDSVISAYAIARELGLPARLVVDSIESFRGLEHRCELVRIGSKNFCSDSFRPKEFASAKANLFSGNSSTVEDRSLERVQINHESSVVDESIAKIFARRNPNSSDNLVCNNFERIVINDSKSTNILNTVHCILALEGLSKIALICGGKFVEQDLTPLDKVIDKISLACCIGSSSKVLENYFQTKNIPTFVGLLEECVEKCCKTDLPIIFSPGYVSSDQYKNFEERGKEFKRFYSHFYDVFDKNE